jgi:streptogramin lyase
MISTMRVTSRRVRHVGSPLRLALVACALAAAALGACSKDGGGTAPTDTAPPAAVTTLAAGSPTLASVGLTWTAPGDDGATGRASQYDIRYSTSPIGEADWDAATPCVGEPAPKGAGEGEAFTADNLNPGTPYYFALKSADEVPNWSALSNVATATTLNPTTAYVFAAKWGSEGSGDGEFSYPFGIAVDGSGLVYVADVIANRIQKFTSEGAYVTQWGSPGSGDSQFLSAYGIATNRDDDVYVADAGSGIGNGIIKRFTSGGTFLTKTGFPLALPEAVAVDGSGNVYVAETGANRIKRLSVGGAVLAEWGSMGGGEGQFDGPQGIAVDASGYVYVADTGNDRIQKFTSQGEFRAEWGASGAGAGELRGPRGLAAGPDGGIFVADSQNSRIQKFTSSGVFLTEWGSLGVGDGEFGVPSAVAVDATGSVYVADTGNCRVQKFSPEP